MLKVWKHQAQWKGKYVQLLGTDLTTHTGSDEFSKCKSIIYDHSVTLDKIQIKDLFPIMLVHVRRP